MKKMEWIIGEVVWFGLLCSVGIVLLGGIGYLVQYGQELIHYQTFLRKADTLKVFFPFSAVGVI